MKTSFNKKAFREMTWRLTNIDIREEDVFLMCGEQIIACRPRALGQTHWTAVSRRIAAATSMATLLDRLIKDGDDAAAKEDAAKLLSWLNEQC